jgi:hypothetical protein
MLEVFQVAKLGKVQTRKRLAEAMRKCAAVFMDGDAHLSNAELNKLLKMRHDLSLMVKKLK